MDTDEVVVKEIQAEAPSPYLPGTNIAYVWDSTMLGWLKSCPRLYQYNKIEGWITEDLASDLRFGQEFHQALADYELERAVNIPHDDAVFDVIRALIDRLGDWNPDHKYKNRENLLRTVIWYFEEFRDDPATTLILANGRPAVEVSFNFEIDYGPRTDTVPYVLAGHLDKVVEYAGEQYVMDHKTTKNTPGEYYFRQFDPDNQVSLYSIAAQVIFQSPIKGVIINAVQTAIDFSAFKRGFIYRNAGRTEEWLIDLRHWLDQAERYAIDGYWPQNDKSCFWCHFKDICSMSPHMRETFLQSKFKRREPWNPLKTR